MTTFIYLLILATVWIWGIRCVFSEGHIFEKAGDWWENKVPEWIYKPTIGCPACMSSIHGSVWYWTWGIILLPDVAVWLKILLWGIFCVCLCGVNFILLETIYKEK